jgi:hypothetical protein
MSTSDSRMPEDGTWPEGAPIPQTAAEAAEAWRLREHNRYLERRCAEAIDLRNRYLEERDRLREAARSAIRNVLDPIYDDENSAGKRIIDELRELVR